jgi:4-hydroxy-tetrahydrodipicolinate synthase
LDHCRRLLAGGCDGINLLGTTGEATSLSGEQRLTVMEAVADGGLPLSRFLVGTGAAALDDAVRLTRRAAVLGFSGALVIPPFYYKGVGDDGVFAFYAALIERVAHPALRLYLYNFPALSGVALGLPLIERLVRAYPQTIAGLKDSSGDLPFAASVVAALPGLAVFPSSEATLLDARRAGFAGCISSTLNITAPLAGLVWNRPDAPEATARRDGLASIRSALITLPPVPAIRHAASRLYADERLRRVLPPLVPLHPSQAAQLDAALDAEPAYRDIVAAAERVA